MDGTKQILEQLKEIKAELDYIKKRIDYDTTLTEDDVLSLKEAEEDFRKKRTKRLV